MLHGVEDINEMVAVLLGRTTGDGLLRAPSQGTVRPQLTFLKSVANRTEYRALVTHTLKVMLLAELPPKFLAGDDAASFDETRGVLRLGFLGSPQEQDEIEAAIGRVRSGVLTAFNRLGWQELNSVLTSARAGKGMLLYLKSSLETGRVPREHFYGYAIRSELEIEKRQMESLLAILRDAAVLEPDAGFISMGEGDKPVGLKLTVGESSVDILLWPDGRYVDVWLNATSQCSLCPTSASGLKKLVDWLAPLGITPSLPSEKKVPARREERKSE